MAKIKGSNGKDKLWGTNEADTIFGRGGNDTIFGRGGNDKISGDDGDDKIFGGAGNDWIHGGKGNDKIFGGSGNDKISGGKGDDTIYGGDGHDRIDGGKGDDYVDGGDGNDRIDGGKGNDTIYGGAGNDWIDGGKGNDFVDGGTGNDKIFGGKGDDTIYGGAGNDRIKGGSGDDLITGGAGADKLTGNSGNDHFIYLANSDSPAGWGWDRITDFTQGHDKIDLAAFRGLDDFVWNDGDGATEFGVWFANSGNSTFVHADTDGDSTADLKIELKHTRGLNLTVDDFIGVSASNALFTENDDIVNFNTVVAGTYTAGTQYDALGDNDMVTLPADAAAALAAGYDPLQTFRGGAGNDQIAMFVTPGAVGNIDAGTGNDTLFLSGNAGGVLEVDLSAPDQVVSIGGVADNIRLQTGFENLDASGLGAGSSVLVNSPTAISNAVIVGSSGGDLIFAFGPNSTVIGGPGDDQIVVSGGNNVLAGGPGDDQFLGGVGDDVFKFSFKLNTTASSDDGFDEIFNFGVGDPFAGNGSDKMRFDFTAADGWDAGFADNADKLAFLEGFFVTNPASSGTRISLQDGTGVDTWSVTVDPSLAAAFGVVDIYVNDVLIG